MKTLSVVLLLAFLIGASAAPIQVSGASSSVASHDVIEGEMGWSIRSSTPVDYSPGVLIGFPASYSFVDGSIITTSSAAGTQFSIGEASVESDSGTLYNTLVIGEFTTGRTYSIGIATIVVHDQNGGYSSAETDIYVTNTTTLSILSNTQEHFYQTDSLTLSQHYNHLARGLTDLVVMYASQGQAPVARVYALISSMMLQLGNVVQHDYQDYDKPIQVSRGVASVQVIPDDVYQCTSAYGSAVKDDGTIFIGGWFTSYVILPSHTNYIHFAGSMSATTISDFTELATTGPLPFTSQSAVLSAGVGGIYNTLFGSGMVMWTIWGFGAVWNVNVHYGSAVVSGSQYTLMQASSDVGGATVRFC